MTGFAGRLKVNRPLRIAVLAVTFVLPLTNVLSGAIVVLMARAAGARTAAIDVGAASALLAVLVQLTNGSPTMAAIGAGALWGGALVSGLLLRRFRSVDLAAQLLVLLAVSGVLLASAVIPDARAHWQPLLEALIQAAGLPQVNGLPDGWLATLAALMHGVIGASLLSTLLMAVVLGLWLDPEGEGAEWRRRCLQLRLGRVLSIGLALAVVLMLAGSVALGGGLLIVFGTGFAAQGLAVLHWTAEERAWPRIWPLALYGLLLLGAPVAGFLLLALALAGLVDNGVSLRRQRRDVV